MTTTAKPKKKKPIIQAKPRSPLTAKRKAAIEAYVFWRYRTKMMSVQGVIQQTIRTERLEPEELYARLEKHGFRYIPRAKRWFPN